MGAVFVEVRLRRVAETRRKIIRLQKRTVELLKRLTFDAAILVRRHARMIAAARLKTFRRYSRLIRISRAVRVGNVFRRRVIARHPAALYLEHGTRPHVIVPRTKLALAFEKEGRLVVRRKVLHPGHRAYRIMTTARRRARRRIADVLKKYRGKIRLE